MTRIHAISVLTASLVSAGGCARSIAMHRPATLADAQQVTQAAAGRMVKVQLATPDRTAAKPETREGVLAIADGSAFVLGKPPEEPRRIPFEHTRSIVVKDRGKGALAGFLAGAIPGALVGASLGSAFDSAGCGEDGSGSRTRCSSEATVTMAIGGALITGLIGGVIGAAIGHRTTFTF
jgi:hypothetical protein